MGIKGLAKFLGDFAPRALKQQRFDTFTGRVIAVDASTSLYQFLVAIRNGSDFSNLTNANGDPTSHIAGMLSRVLRLLEYGIKPVYVFDGKPPLLKTGELARRRDKREKASAALETAKEAGDKDEIKKQISRTVKVTKEHNDQIKRLLTLMGIPIVEAPCEAEAQCAELTKSGKAYATATEDADALTFGATTLLRNLTFTTSSSASSSASSAPPVFSIHLPTALEELQLTMEQFVDLCILCGCDYCDTIRGIGAKTAYTLIKEHKNIEGVLSAIDPQKNPPPEHFPFQEARDFFLHPEVISAASITLSWRDPDEDGLRHFLIKENQFNESRVEGYFSRLKKAKSKTSQSRLENFFGASSMKMSSTAQAAALAKAKAKEKARERVKVKAKAATSAATHAGGGPAGGSKTSVASGAATEKITRTPFPPPKYTAFAISSPKKSAPTSSTSAASSPIRPASTKPASISATFARSATSTTSAAPASSKTSATSAATPASTKSARSTTCEASKSTSSLTSTAGKRGERDEGGDGEALESKKRRVDDADDDHDGPSDEGQRGHRIAGGDKEEEKNGFCTPETPGDDAHDLDDPAKAMVHEGSAGETKQSKDGAQRHFEDAQDVKEIGGVKDAKGLTILKGVNDARDVKDPKDVKDVRDVKDAKDVNIVNDIRDAKAVKDEAENVNVERKNLSVVHAA